MSHEQGDGLVSTATGFLLVMVAQAARWVEAAHWGGEVLHAVVFGLIGGAAGYGGKRVIERLTTRRNKPNQEQ